MGFFPHPDRRNYGMLDNGAPNPAADWQALKHPTFKEGLGQVAAGVQRFHDIVLQAFDGRIDGHNISADTFDPDTFTHTAQTQSAAKVFKLKLADDTGNAFIRLKTDPSTLSVAKGVEVFVKASATDSYGRFCIGDSADTQTPKRQLASIIPDPASGTNPGATYQTTYGAATFNTGGAFDVIVKRNGAEGLRLDGTGLLASKAIRFATGLAGPQITGPSDVTLTLKSNTTSMVFTQSDNISFSFDDAGPYFGGAPIWWSGNDGSGSGLDADLLDGHDTSYFQIAGSYQPLDATLTALAGLATGANKVPYSTGTDTFSQYAISATPGATTVPVADGSNKLADGWLSDNIPLKNGANNFSALNSVKAGGASTQQGTLGGTIYNSATSAGNVGTGEDDLHSYTVPANTWNLTGDTVEFFSAGTFSGVGTANKRLRAYLDATLIFDTGAIGFSASTDWELTGRIMKSGSGAVRCSVTLTTSSATLSAYTQYTALSKTLTNGLILKTTGETSGVGTADNDIVEAFIKASWQSAAPA